MTAKPPRVTLGLCDSCGAHIYEGQTYARSNEDRPSLSGVRAPWSVTILLCATCAPRRMA
jgi:hypothetical protein